MQERSKAIDQIDTAILAILQNDCRTPLKQIATIVGVSMPTVRYRLRRMEKEGIIVGYQAKIDAAKLGKRCLTITFVRAKYGPEYNEKIGKMLSRIPGVSGVYFVFGEIDFIVTARSDSIEDFTRKLSVITNMAEIERSSTQIVAEVVKDDPRIDLGCS